MKWIMLTAATANEVWSKSAEAVYTEKISHFVEFELKSIKPNKTDRSSAEKKRQDDSETILKQISPDDYVVLFDENGQRLNSIQFSKKLNMILNSGKKKVYFVIGGAYGANESLKNRANLIVSLSEMVFNHLVAQTVALEQIYRGMTILKNLPYHNQ